MKYFIVILLLLSSCSKKTVDHLVETKNQENNSTPEGSKSLGNGPFELFLGIHNIEYFADRMVLKSKLSGYDFAKKTTFEKDGETIYQVILGPFNSQAEAEAADKAIKERTPDLDISKVRAVK